jgi:hypothetical protein
MHGLVTTPRGRRSRTNRTISRRSAALADPGVLQNWVRRRKSRKQRCKGARCDGRRSQDGEESRALP